MRPDVVSCRNVDEGAPNMHVTENKGLVVDHVKKRSSVLHLSLCDVTLF